MYRIQKPARERQPLLGCRVLLTEDQQYGQRFSSVTVQNPLLEET
jgi:hypothetical protein